ncbi:MAG: response regulator [Myxococcota bacterium]|nr:response regulator [Myxococcota bacterium]
MYLEYLQFAGFRSIEASDGREAIAKAVELFPSLILMDLAMPTMDGWEATRRLKADPRTKSIPVIAVTGHALRGDAERALQAGCDGVISKPCLPEQLVEEVRRVLARDN